MSTWLMSRWVSEVIVVADASSPQQLDSYEDVLAGLREAHRGRVIYKLRQGRSGSVHARNLLLELAEAEGCRYAIMADDDYILPDPEFPLRMSRWLLADSEVGAVSGRVEQLRRRSEDPDFFLNVPLPIADALSRALGYVFLDVRSGPRYAEYLTPFFMLRGELLGRVRYDAAYDTPTAFREESDVHEQVRRLGYRLVMDPRVYVYHLGLEYGGDRLGIPMGERMYWKARNHAKFVMKWRREPLRVWHLLAGALLLATYKPWHAVKVLKGLRDGLH